MNDNIFFAAASILLKVSIDIVRVARKNIVLFFFLQLLSPDHFCPRIICTESHPPTCAHRFFLYYPFSPRTNLKYRDSPQ